MERNDMTVFPVLPENYKLNIAIVTTYDVEVDVLKKMLAGQRDKDRFLIFYGGGDFLEGPAGQKREEVLQSQIIDITLPSGNPDYPLVINHGKVWLFEYISETGDYEYRLVIGSRNISSFENLEIGVMLRSVPCKEDDQRALWLMSYLEAITDCMNEKDTGQLKYGTTDKVLELNKRLEKVSFAIDGKWESDDYRIVTLFPGAMLINRINNSIFAMCRDYDELVICSPFIDYKLLQMSLSGKRENGRVVVISNKTVIDELKAVAGNSSCIVFLMPGNKKYVHAKFFLRRREDRFDLYLGSMNATGHGLNQNYEVMIHINDPAGVSSADEFIYDVIGETTC